jgi:hypothetical protein
MNSMYENNIYTTRTIDKQSIHYNKIEIDTLFIEQLKRLDETTLRTGKKLLSRIRKITRGRFSYNLVSGRFVESPDPYWSIQIEESSNRFCIVVFGRPHEHSPTQNLKMNKFMKSYSIFYIDNINQIDEAIVKIVQAKKIMKVKKTFSYFHH